MLVIVLDKYFLPSLDRNDGTHASEPKMDEGMRLAFVSKMR